MHPINHPIRILKIATLSILLSTLIISSLPDTHALTPSYRISLCEKTHYGVNYTRLREATCELIWKKLSYDVLPTNE